MERKLKISILDSLKRPNTGNKIKDRLFAILSIPLLPVLILLGLIVILFSGLLSLWQRISTSKMYLQKQKRDNKEVESKDNKWSIFTSDGSILIEQQIAGSLPWDSGNYLHLKSKPTISYLSDKLFGDWLLDEFGGVFLQKWNDIRNFNCDLVFVDYKTLKVIELKTDLPTKNWKTERLNSDEIKFTFTSTDSELTHIVKRNEINQN